MQDGSTLIVQKAIAGAAFVVLLPVMATTGIAVAASLGRPVLFIQERSGRFQQPFRLVKFRTMRNTRDLDGQLLPDAMRTSRLGSFLRKTRIDELPGLINVMRGDMALVGPRPLLPQTIAALGPAGQTRASVRPGMTGWAQVNGNTLLSNEQKVARDLWYIEHRSWHLDARILLKTLLVVVAGERVSG